MIAVAGFVWLLSIVVALRTDDERWYVVSLIASAALPAAIMWEMTA